MTEVSLLNSSLPFLEVWYIFFQFSFSIFLPPCSPNKKLGNCFEMSHLKLAQLEKFKNSQLEEQRCLPETNTVNSSSLTHFKFPQGDRVDVWTRTLPLPSSALRQASTFRLLSSWASQVCPSPRKLRTREFLLPSPESLTLCYSLITSISFHVNDVKKYVLFYCLSFCIKIIHFICL